MSVHFNKARQNWFAKWYEQGKEKRRYFRTEQEARAFENERLAALDDDPRLTLGDLVVKYFQANPDKHPRYKKYVVYALEGYQDQHGKRHEGPLEFLRDKYAESLNRQDLEMLREAYRKRGVSNNTINHAHTYISAILSWGADQGLLPFHPWRDFKKLKMVKPVFQPRIEDLQKVYVHLPEYMQWAVKTAFALALRPGQVELFGLHWTAFNWRRGIVVIRQGKSGKLKTVVPPESYLVEARERYEADMAAGIPLVCHRNGKRVLDYRKSWLTACNKAGVKMRFYDARHIVASEMLARGADLAAVAAQMGHCSVATTGAVYAHITQGSQAYAASLVPELGSDTIVIQDDTKK